MRSQKDFTFSNGATVRVHEISSADLDLFYDLGTQATATTFEDQALAVFARVYYPVLAACTDGAPSLEESYRVEPDKLDQWFALCCDQNTDWLGKQSYKEETVKLNGSKMVIKSRRPSVEMRLARLQQEAAKDSPSENPKDEEYRTGAYLGAAAASFGDVPTPHQARHEWSLKDMNAWHAAVRKMIPEWYAPEEVTEQEKQTEAEKKSYDKNPAG